MNILFDIRLLVALVAISLSTSFVQNAQAKSGYGAPVDAACLSFNGTEPFSDQGCALCHTSNYTQRVDPEWTWWEQQALTNFCPPASNTPPA